MYDHGEPEVHSTEMTSIVLLLIRSVRTHTAFMEKVSSVRFVA